MDEPSGTVNDLKRAFGEEGITLLAREDVDRQSPTISKRGPTILLSMTPRVMVAICDTPAAAERMEFTSLVILGNAARTEFAKAVHKNVAAFCSASDGATRERIGRAIARLVPPES